MDSDFPRIGTIQFAHSRFKTSLPYFIKQPARHTSIIRSFAEYTAYGDS